MAGGYRLSCLQTDGGPKKGPGTAPGPSANVRDSVIETPAWSLLRAHHEEHLAVPAGPGFDSRPHPRRRRPGRCRGVVLDTREVASSRVRSGVYLGGHGTRQLTTGDCWPELSTANTKASQRGRVLSRTAGMFGLEPTLEIGQETARCRDVRAPIGALQDGLDPGPMPIGEMVEDVTQLVDLTPLYERESPKVSR